MGHHPIYSVGYHGNTRISPKFQQSDDKKYLLDTVLPLLEKYDIPIYLCGHDHNMQVIESQYQSKNTNTNNNQTKTATTHFIVTGNAGKRSETHRPKINLNPKKFQIPYNRTVTEKLFWQESGYAGYANIEANEERMLISLIKSHDYNNNEEPGYHVFYTIEIPPMKWGSSGEKSDGFKIGCSLFIVLGSVLVHSV